LIPYRELDETLGLSDTAAQMLADWRTGKNTQHTVSAMVRQSVFSRLAGYEDTNDAERLCVDPTMRHVVGGRARNSYAASTSQMGLFETEVLTQPHNLEPLMNLSGIWIDRVHGRKPVRKIILDMDSSVSDTDGGSTSWPRKRACFRPPASPVARFHAYGPMPRRHFQLAQRAASDTISDSD